MILKQADLDFILAQIRNPGANPLPGFDPFSSAGIRNVDGVNNNLLNIDPTNPDTPFVDQFGHSVFTNTFGTSNQPFIVETHKTFVDVGAPGGTDNYAQSNTAVIDGTPRLISNL